MKVVGTAEGGFLVSATEVELANICGAYGAHTAPWANSASNIRGGTLQPGTVIPVADMYRRLCALAEGERKLKEGAANLRALATMMEANLPSVILPETPADV